MRGSRLTVAAIHPARTTTTSDDPRDALTTALTAGTLTADELLCQYCTLIYAQTGSYEEAARRLKLDRRTVKAKLDRELLAKLNRD